MFLVAAVERCIYQGILRNLFVTTIASVLDGEVNCFLCSSFNLKEHSSSMTLRCRTFNETEILVRQSCGGEHVAKSVRAFTQKQLAEFQTPRQTIPLRSCRLWLILTDSGNAPHLGNAL